MKKILLIVLCVSVSLLALSQFGFAKKTTIQFWPEANVFQRWPERVAEFETLYPDIKVKLEEIPTQSIREKVAIAYAAGCEPNLYSDYLGGLAIWKYYDATIDLNEVLSQEILDDTVPSILDIFTIEGELMALPTRYWVITYLVNKTIIDRAGAGNLLPGKNDFPLKDWMAIAEKVKALGWYPTYFFANGHFGDYWMLMNYQIFGASLYEGGDHTKITLNSEAGVKALDWMLDIVDRGWAPGGVAGLTDADLLQSRWQTSVMVGGVPNYAPPKFEQEMLDAGNTKELMDFVITRTPHAEGVDSPPLFIGPTGVLAFKTNDPAKLEATKKFIRFLATKEQIEKTLIASRQFSPRLSINTFEEKEAAMLWTQEIIALDGVGDMGIASPHYIEARHALVPEQQAAFMGKKTPQQALDDFASAIARAWEAD